jgi:hypothetical protein
MSIRTAGSGLGIALAAALVFGTPARLAGHDIPTDARLQLFFKPEGRTLRLLIRAPMASLNDIDWPTDGSVLLDLARLEPAMRQAATTWLAERLEVRENDRVLPTPRIAAVMASLPADTSFDSYDNALARVTGPPLPADTELVRNQALLDVLFEYEIASDQSDFAIHPRFDLLGLEVTTVLRFLPPGGAERAFSLHNDPGLVWLDPSWFQAAWSFVASGFFHILDGIDHLLFLLCLVIPFRRIGALVPIVTSFTLAHSITLIASAYGVAPEALWFPPLVETLIATSIVYMALENIASPGLNRRWAITFGFGLVHGFGFSFALRDQLQFAGSHLLTSLLSFNVGVEFGQLLVLLLLVPAVDLLFRHVVAERVGTAILSALIAHTAWHWMTDRGAQLGLYRFEVPVIDAAFFAKLVEWLIVLVIAAAAAWLISLLAGSRLFQVSPKA